MMRLFRLPMISERRKISAFPKAAVIWKKLFRGKRWQLDEDAEEYWHSRRFTHGMSVLFLRWI